MDNDIARGWRCHGSCVRALRQLDVQTLKHPRSPQTVQAMLDLKGRTRSEDRNHVAMSDRANGLPTVSVVAVAREDADVTIRDLTARYGRWAQFGVELIVV